MSWYRTGRVTVTNGSKTVTGVGTLWTTAVNVGDAFALVDANLNPTGAWKESARGADDCSAWDRLALVCPGGEGNGQDRRVECHSGDRRRTGRRDAEFSLGG